MADEDFDRGRKTEDMVIGGLYLFQGSVDNLVGRYEVPYLSGVSSRCLPIYGRSECNV